MELMRERHIYTTSDFFVLLLVTGVRESGRPQLLNGRRAFTSAGIDDLKLGKQASPQVEGRKEESDCQVLERVMCTYCCSPTSLGDSSLVQIISCLVNVLGGFFCALFILQKIGDGDV